MRLEMSAEHKLGPSIKIADADFLTLAAENSDRDLAKMFGAKPTAVSSHRKMATFRESKRQGVPMAEVGCEVDDARAANGVLNTAKQIRDHKATTEKLKNGASDVDSAHEPAGSSGKAKPVKKNSAASKPKSTESRSAGAKPSKATKDGRISKELPDTPRWCGNARLTDNAFLALLLTNTNAEIVDKLDTTISSVRYRRRHSVLRESKRQNRSADDMFAELDAARVSSGKLQHVAHIGEARPKQLKGQEDAQSSSEGVRGDDNRSSTNADFGMDDNDDSSDDDATCEVVYNPFQKSQPTVTSPTPQGIQEKMAVSALLNPADQMQLD